MTHDLAGRENRGVGCEALNARGDIDGLAEIILSLIEHHGEAWPFVDADLHDEIACKAAHGFTHPQGRGEGAIRRWKGRHHGIADGFHYRAGLDSNDLVQRAEMGSHQIVSREIANPIIEFSRALEIGKQKGQARDLQSLVDIDRVGTIKISKCLIGQKTFSREKRAASAQQFMKLVAGDPNARQASGRRSDFRGESVAGPAEWTPYPWRRAFY